MGEHSKIEWTHHTFNPWWGCVRVSPGCEHCYAESFAKRTGHNVWGVQAPRRFFGEKHWAEPLKWNEAAKKAGERRRVFVASMADVFEDRPELVGPRSRLWSLIADTPHLDWLLLTKRPENAARLWVDAACNRQAGTVFPRRAWLPNIWFGATVEDNKRRDERLPHLLATPAAVRFVSYEPALEAVDFSGEHGGNDYLGDHYDAGEPGIDWVIVGGESGPGARPFDVAWARSVVRQCRDAGTTVFVKQLGARPKGEWGSGRLPQCSDHPARRGEWVLRDRKGGDMAEWPEDLRVREFPEVRHG